MMGEKCVELRDPLTGSCARLALFTKGLWSMRAGSIDKACAQARSEARYFGGQARNAQAYARSALIEFSKGGKERLVKSILKNKNVLGPKKHHALRHALLGACESNETGCARMLIKSGANPNIKNEAGATPLMQMCWRGDLRMAMQLVEAGAKLGARDESGWDALMYATSKNQASVCEFLLSKGALPRQKTGSQDVFELAAPQSNRQALEALSGWVKACFEKNLLEKSIRKGNGRKGKGAGRFSI